MLGSIIGTDGNKIIIKLNVDLTKIQNLVNLYVIMEDQEKKFVGEIVDIKDNNAYAALLGEFINDKFVFGVMSKPAFSASVKLISKEKAPLVIGIDDYKENRDLYFGTSPIYPGVQIGVNLNDFFSGHFAVFGSTGSGKSCSIARIFQNLFEKEKYIPYRASIFMFDAYGEYHNAFKDLNKKVPEIGFKAYTTNTNADDAELVKIPVWLLDVDDIAVLLGVEKVSQLPIIEKALKLVTIFGREENIVIKHKNDIIARALLEILTSGRPSTQIRDQVISILSSYSTKELNLETEVFQPGYIRTLKQCLLIDSSGKMREMELLVTFIEKFADDSLELTMPDGSFKYSLDDLRAAFDFALISEGILKSDKVFDEVNTLKVRLHSLINGNYSKYFDYEEFITEEQYIKNLLTTSNGKKAQIINFNINFVDDRFAKSLTKIFSKMLFNYSKDMDEKTSLPFNIILEEAHRYVQNDTDKEVLGYNIFDRITKEGRKYGVMLGLISQRPSELSETSLSQCTNFLIFKMLHPTDVRYIKEMVPNITNETVEKLRILQPGNCIAFGSSFKVPILVKFEMPDPAPTSSSCNITDTWFIEKKQN